MFQGKIFPSIYNLSIICRYNNNNNNDLYRGFISWIFFVCLLILCNLILTFENPNCSCSVMRGYCSSFWYQIKEDELNYVTMKIIFYHWFNFIGEITALSGFLFVWDALHFIYIVSHFLFARPSRQDVYSIVCTFAFGNYRWRKRIFIIKAIFSSFGSD